jgi:Ni,Fe-hydrogenase III small subunit/formate hydrogenlyase subunit 6/NADH:ubiquinone oxidoreductase subunit I
MFKILKQAVATGIVTTDYPKIPIEPSPNFRGRPVIDFGKAVDCLPAARVCPTGALKVQDDSRTRKVSLDLGFCIFCGLCAEASPEGAIRMSHESELAVRQRSHLVSMAQYRLDGGGKQQFLKMASVDGSDAESGATAEQKLNKKIHRVLGRSLQIRQVDAGSCNGCEVEITGLNSPIYDAERLGIRFVASPRHADMLLVTGPVTRNMEIPLKKAYDATPEPRLVVAVGACGCSGGIFGCNYASLGGVDQVIPVDVYIPGCPPPPQALLHGLLLAVGRLEGRSKPYLSGRVVD